MSQSKNRNKSNKKNNKKKTKFKSNGDSEMYVKKINKMMNEPQRNSKKKSKRSSIQLPTTKHTKQFHLKKSNKRLSNSNKRKQNKNRKYITQKHTKIDHKIIQKNKKNIKSNPKTSHTFSSKPNINNRKKQRKSVHFNENNVLKNALPKRIPNKNHSKNKKLKRAKSIIISKKQKNISKKSLRKKRKDKIRAKSVYIHSKNEKKELKKVRDNYECKNNTFDRIKIGNIVLLTKHREGIVKYIGKVDFANGIWYGIQLINGNIGLHNGIIDGKRYFKTAAYRGLFVQKNSIRRKIRDKDHYSSQKLRRRASLQQIAKLKDKTHKTINKSQKLQLKNINVNNDKNLIVKQGIFRKRGALNKSFKRRWFKLYIYNKLSYFELNNECNGSEGIEKGCIDLMDVIDINVKKNHLIEMKTQIEELSSERKWVFEFDTVKDRHEWYNVLRQFCGHNVHHSHSHRHRTQNSSLPWELQIFTP
eukprot:331716_1